MQSSSETLIQNVKYLSKWKILIKNLKLYSRYWNQLCCKTEEGALLCWLCAFLQLSKGKAVGREINHCLRVRQVGCPGAYGKSGTQAPRDARQRGLRDNAIKPNYSWEERGTGGLCLPLLQCLLWFLMARLETLQLPAGHHRRRESQAAGQPVRRAMFRCCSPFSGLFWWVEGPDPSGAC